MKLFKGLLVAALLLTGCAAPAGNVNEPKGEEPKNPAAEPIKVLAPTGVETSLAKMVKPCLY